MPTPSGDAPIDFPDDPPQDQIASLAVIYDRFAHALDPHSPESDHAERLFLMEISVWYDQLPRSKPTLHEFTKAVISRCRKHLIATSKPPSV